MTKQKLDLDLIERVVKARKALPNDFPSHYMTLLIQKLPEYDSHKGSSFIKRCWLFRATDQKFTEALEKIAFGK